MIELQSTQPPVCTMITRYSFIRPYIKKIEREERQTTFKTFYFYFSKRFFLDQ